MSQFAPIHGLPSIRGIDFDMLKVGQGHGSALIEIKARENPSAARKIHELQGGPAVVASKNLQTWLTPGIVWNFRLPFHKMPVIHTNG
jgi:hypothetical protein